MLDTDRIRLRRLELRLSQKALGKAIGQDQSYLSRVENGIVAEVTADTLGRIARTLQLPMEELLILDAEDKPKTPAKPKNRRGKPPVSKPNAKTTARKRARTPAKG